MQQPLKENLKCSAFMQNLFNSDNPNLCITEKRLSNYKLSDFLPLANGGFSKSILHNNFYKLTAPNLLFS